MNALIPVNRLERVKDGGWLMSAALGEREKINTLHEALASPQPAFSVEEPERPVQAHGV
jgi:hypothetical protein